MRIVMMHCTAGVLCNSMFLAVRPSPLYGESQGFRKSYALGPCNCELGQLSPSYSAGLNSWALRQ